MTATEARETSPPTRATTRQQRDLVRALKHVTAVSHKDEGVRKIYGGLCHSFPVLVRTCGLCQALAFVEAKATSRDQNPSERVQAYRTLREHIAELLGKTALTLLDTVRDDSMTDYMRHTRTVLGAWIYYKRFAVSILKVDSAQAAENEGSAKAEPAQVTETVGERQ